MKIERLSLQAFGPYVKRQDIDFAALSKRHIFLIQGETGAGKTILLDAITYALYGKSSGGERGDLESMRCRFAKEHLPTFVELIFSIQAVRYRFYREVRVHQKRSGEVTWKMQIDGGCYENGEYQPFFENCKLKLLEEKAEELIGLSHAQFIQVMMLPQGKFEQLLVSKSEEKQEILKTLFQMENWEAICNRLQEKQRLARQEIEKLQQTMTLLFAQAKVSSLEELDTQLESLEEQVAKGQKEQALMAEEVQRLQKAKEEQMQLHQIQQRYDEQMKNLQVLLSKQEEMEAKKQEIQRLQQLEQLRPYAQACAQARKQVEQRKQTLSSLIEGNDKLQKQEAELSKQQLLLPKWKEAHRILEQELHHLNEGVKEVEKIAVLQNEEKMLHSNIQAIEKQIHMDKEQIESIQKLQQEKQQQQFHYEEILAKYPALVAEEQRYANAKGVLASITYEQTQIGDEEAQLLLLSRRTKKMQAQEKQLQTTYTAMYEQYIQNSAALLAQLLEEGKPCPVCGSLHHETRAHIQGQQMEVTQLQHTKQELETLQADLLTFENERRQRMTSIQQHQQQQRTLQQQMETILPSGYDEKLHDALCLQVEEAMQASTKKEQLLNQQKEIASTLQTLTMQWKKHEETQMKLCQEQAVVQANIAEKSRLLSHAYASLTDIQNAAAKKQAEEIECLRTIERIEEASKQFAHEKTMQETAYLHAKKELQQAEVQLANAVENYQNRCEGKHYEEEDFNFASLETSKQELEQYTTHLVEVQASVHELASQLQGKKQEDIHILQEQLQKQTQRYQETLSKQAHVESERKQQKQLRSSLVSYRTTYEAKQTTYAHLSDFVKAMRGDNGIGIERYVLGVMLSSITQSANQLLRKVHQGRYQIYRSDETSGRTRKSGLELNIYDAYSCSYRSVVSLSGGEKFLVSLALSLALSTVVQARSGGFRMESMFIDEGFGSLDEQSIDDALQVLMSMSQSKGMIAIISHVEVLKENIPYGIHVYKNQEGSTIQVNV